MTTIYYVLIFSLLGGVVSLLGGVLLLSKKKSANALARYATPFAAGALLAAVFLDLLKEGIEITEPYAVLMMTLVGIVAFFLLENFLRWFHHHHVHDDKASDPSTSLVIVGDTLHNVLDGVAIAASFLVSVPTGIVTTLAVAAHEIPQEIGDFGILLHKGMSRRKVLFFNFLSALATTAAALLVYLVGSTRDQLIGTLFGLSAGFLLYVALSDLIPEVHRSASKKRLLSWQPLLLLCGVVVVSLSINLAHKYIDAGHTNESHQHVSDCVEFREGDEQVMARDCADDHHDVNVPEADH